MRVLDAGVRPGGVISTQEKDGFRFELGPQSFLSTDPLLKLIDALGLKNELLHADSRAPRYILFRGQLVPAPLAPPSLLTTPLLGAAHEMAAFHGNVSPHDPSCKRRIHRRVCAAKIRR